MVTPSNYNVFAVYADSLKSLTLESNLSDLTLYDTVIDVRKPAKELVRFFEADKVVPGVILTQNQDFYGMVSRQRFLQQMSRPYALEIFLHRPITTLYGMKDFPVNILPDSTPILEAAQFALERNNEQIYEPLVVAQEDGSYALIDIPLVLYAQSHIHKLTSQQLKEQTHAHLVQTEKMASLGRMVAGVAHEIRNPVNCVHGNMSFLQEYFESLLALVRQYEADTPNPTAAIAQCAEDIELDFLAEDLPKILQSVEVSAVRMTEIVTSLRTFARIDETKQQLINVPECIDSTLLILTNRCRKQRVQVIKNYAPALPEILGYSGQLSQVFLNLLANALDALEEKQQTLQSGDHLNNWQPTLTIDVLVTEDEHDEEKDWLCIDIKDNAQGIPKEIQHKIFKDFFTTKSSGKGTGLGLAISNEIITDRHHGRLGLKSKLGQGSTFSVLLPVRRLTLG